MMARLNVYVPDELSPLVERWRDRVNLSEVCTRALRETLDALDSGRSIGSLLDHLGPPSALEETVARRFGLRRVVVAPQAPGKSDTREQIAAATSAFLERTLMDGVTVGVAGGRQMWATVRRMTARSVRLHLNAIGVGQVDPTVLNAHPNTLVTLLWLLYSPRTSAQLVGSPTFTESWNTRTKPKPTLERLIVGSCSSFDPSSSYSQLIGDRYVGELTARGARGDFLGVFLAGDGSIIDCALDVPESLIKGAELAKNAKRKDTVVALSAGGDDKLETMRLTLAAGLCNTLITDDHTAEALLK